MLDNISYVCVCTAHHERERKREQRKIVSFFYFKCVGFQLSSLSLFSHHIFYIHTLAHLGFSLLCENSLGCSKIVFGIVLYIYTYIIFVAEWFSSCVVLYFLLSFRDGVVV